VVAGASRSTIRDHEHPGDKSADDAVASTLPFPPHHPRRTQHSLSIGSDGLEGSASTHIHGRHGGRVTFPQRRGEGVLVRDRPGQPADPAERGTSDGILPLDPTH